VETTSPFGVVMIREGREVGTGAISFSGIGTIAEIRDAGRHEDGRFDLLVVGTRRFSIRRVLEGRPYLVADAEILDERVDDPAIAQQLANKATRRFVTYLELLQPRSGETSEDIDVRVEVETEEDAAEEGDETPADEADEEAGEGTQPDDSGTPSDKPRRRRVLIPDDPTILSHLLAGILQIELPRRQALLELDTTEERLRALLGLIDREILLLRRRLRAFTPDPRVAGPRRS
ncbi:MAG TPA: LON peptidase substrate-binding domain-containing protein, partial [Candidatus Limnocylindrales bacterium]